jgi:hypothetical protein
MYITSVSTTASSAAVDSSNMLDVTAVSDGSVLSGAIVTGTGVPVNTSIVSQSSGTTGKVGVYTLNQSGTAVAVAPAVAVTQTAFPNGPTYASTISSVSSSTAVVVTAPCPAFSTAQKQHVYYGHDDAAAWNSAIAYLGTYSKSLSEIKLFFDRAFGSSCGLKPSAGMRGLSG